MKLTRHEAKILTNDTTDNSKLFEQMKRICKSHLIQATALMDIGEPFDAYREFGGYVAIASIYFSMTQSTALMIGTDDTDTDISNLIHSLILTDWNGIPFMELDNDTILAVLIERNEDEYLN